MVLLASNFDKSKYLKAADLDKEKKFRIKSATDEVVGIGDDKEHRLIFGSRTMSAGSFLIVPTSASCAKRSATSSTAGSARSSRSIQPRSTSAASSFRHCGCVSRRRNSLLRRPGMELPQHRRHSSAGTEAGSGSG